MPSPYMPWPNTDVGKLQFIKGVGLDFRGTLGKLEKAKDPLRPIFEALTNALDAIAAKTEESPNGNRIEIAFHFSTVSTLFTNVESEQASFKLERIEITDTGVGLTDKDYRRMERLNDDSKSKLNKGSGRIQYLKFFEETVFLSYFRDLKSPSEYLQRTGILSAKPAYLQQNAILKFGEPRIAKPSEVPPTGTGTRVQFQTPLDEKDQEFYQNLTLEELKKRILAQYLVKFHYERDRMPVIALYRLLDGKTFESLTLDVSDVPRPKKSQKFSLAYKRITKSSTEHRIVFEKSDKVEKFQLDAFVLPSGVLDKNYEAFVSRGEFVRDARLELLPSGDRINESRYIVALSSDYIDRHVSESRGNLEIPSDDDVKKKMRPLLGPALFEYEREEWITLDDVREEARGICARIFPELEARKEEQYQEVERLRQSFGISKAVADRVKSKLRYGDSKTVILEKLYDVEAQDSAQKDSVLDDVVQKTLALNPLSDDFEEELRKQVGVLASAVPGQNRNALSHYFARRKLIVSIFRHALERNLNSQTSGNRNVDEKILHNILFRQHSTSPFDSALWMLSEEYVYFEGTSDVALKDICYRGQKLLQNIENCSEEDREYLFSSNEDRTKKRPDILLFPEEGKCVVIEFKRPDVNLSNCIPQINKYASIIYNFCAPEFPIRQFYVFLIGGALNSRDVRAVESNYKDAPSLGYLYGTRPVPGDGKPDGEMYMEVHTYETLLKRAERHNKTFFDLLDKREEDL